MAVSSPSVNMSGLSSEDSSSGMGDMSGLSSEDSSSDDDLPKASKKQKLFAKKSVERDRRKEKEQKRKMDKNIISMEDFLRKQQEFKLWLNEEKKISAYTMKSPKLKEYFKKFIKQWNNRKLQQKYYRGITACDTPPVTPRSENRFSFVQIDDTADIWDNNHLGDPVQEAVPSPLSTFGKAAGKQISGIPATSNRRPLMPKTSLNCSGKNDNGPLYCSSDIIKNAYTTSHGLHALNSLLPIKRPHPDSSVSSTEDATGCHGDPSKLIDEKCIYDLPDGSTLNLSQQNTEVGTSYVNGPIYDLPPIETTGDYDVPNVETVCHYGVACPEDRGHHYCEPSLTGVVNKAALQQNKGQHIYAVPDDSLSSTGTDITSPKVIRINYDIPADACPGTRDNLCNKQNNQPADALPQTPIRKQSTSWEHNKQANNSSFSPRSKTSAAPGVRYSGNQHGSEVDMSKDHSAEIAKIKHGRPKPLVPCKLIPLQTEPEYPAPDKRINKIPPGNPHTDDVTSNGGTGADDNGYGLINIKKYLIRDQTSPSCTQRDDKFNINQVEQIRDVSLTKPKMIEKVNTQNITTPKGIGAKKTVGPETTPREHRPQSAELPTLDFIPSQTNCSLEEGPRLSLEKNEGTKSTDTVSEGSESPAEEWPTPPPPLKLSLLETNV